jgi:hypothetical protein
LAAPLEIGNEPLHVAGELRPRLITTPATVLNPFVFLDDVRYVIGDYASGHHPGHHNWSGGEHGMRMLEYFGGAVFSVWPAVALTVFAFSLIGLYALAREGKTAIVFLSFPRSTPHISPCNE